MRNIEIRTTAQKIIIKSHSELTLEEILRVNNLPVNLFQGYTSSNQKLTPVPLNKRLGDFSEDTEVVLQCVRNTDLRQVLPQKRLYKRVVDPVISLHNLEFEGGKCVETVYELNSDLARKIVEEKVSRFIAKYSSAEVILAGISGGGDSNTLVRSLKNATRESRNQKEVICFTLVFDPIWPSSAAKRAKELCQENGVKHLIYDDKRIEHLLGMKGSLRNFYLEFSEKFGSNTSHFFATHLISLVARRLGSQLGTNEYCLGFNREDVLAELLFSLINGQKPLAFPVRMFGDTKLLMPLWEIPKVILDACYPEYSSENYQERMDTTTFQRSIIYYLAHSVDESYNNFGLSLMHGVRNLFEDSWSKISHEESFDLYISEYADPERVEEVKKVLKKFF